MEASALHAPPGSRRISLHAPLLRLRSDDQLVALFRAGNDDAFRVIHDRYRQRLFAYMRQMLAGSRPDAEDALQDVFLRAYGALRADDRPIALRAWLYRVAHNRCIDQLRRPVPAAADVFDVTPLAAVRPARRGRAARGPAPAGRRRAPAARAAALGAADARARGPDATPSSPTRSTCSVPAVKSLLVRARHGPRRGGRGARHGCAEIRADLAARPRPRRARQRPRRGATCATAHGCRDYRSGLRQVQRSFGALAPAGGRPAGLLAKLGLGGSGSAAAGGGAASGTGLIGGGAATAHRGQGLRRSSARWR